MVISGLLILNHPDPASALDGWLAVNRSVDNQKSGEAVEKTSVRGGGEDGRGGGMRNEVGNVYHFEGQGSYGCSKE